MNTNTTETAHGRKRNKKKILGIAAAGTLIAGLTLAALSQTNTFNAFLRYNFDEASKSLPTILLTDTGAILPAEASVNLLNGLANNSEEFLMPVRELGPQRHATSISRGPLDSAFTTTAVSTSVGGTVALTNMLTSLKTNIANARAAYIDGLVPAELAAAGAQFDSYINTLTLKLNLAQQATGVVEAFNADRFTSAPTLANNTCVLNLNLGALAGTADAITALSTGCFDGTEPVIGDPIAVSEAAPVTLNLAADADKSTTRTALFFSLNTTATPTENLTLGNADKIDLQIPALAVNFTPTP